MKKQYKVGDRIFYECYDGTIGTGIIKEIRNDSYHTDKGKEIKFQYLIVDISDNGRHTIGIEDYNCLSPKDPKCKEIAKKYEKLDSSNVINSIVEILTSYKDLDLDELFTIIKFKLNK